MVATITEKEALKELRKIKKKDLIQLVLDLKNEKMFLLGEGECFIHRGRDGFLESIKTNVYLHESKKEIYSLGNKWCISSDGYNKLNQAAGLSFINIEKLNIYGKETGNPYFEMGEEGVKSITVRRVVVGPAPIGNIVAIERLLRFDLDLYLLDDLQYKVKNRANAGGWGTQDVRPSIIPSDHTAVFFKVGPAALWVDMDHPDIQEAFSDHIRRCKFSVRMATSICERNALAVHPAIARKNVEPTAGVAIVPVYGGKKILDERRIKEITEAYAKGEQSKLDGVEIIEAKEIEEVGFEEVAQIEENDEFSPNDETEEKSEKEPKPIEKSSAWKKAHEQVIAHKEANTPAYFKLLGAYQIRNLKLMTVEGLICLRKKLENL